ncbi:EcsC family protein [Acinetobacter sp. WZC-1]|uniref:EcsC family protein n=1 Tax=Acinetobacter sp. WZC-1 TaxID=3459034 RepID=UPI00403D721C
MADSSNRPSRGLISSAFGVAKKFSAVGLNALNHVAPGTVSTFQASDKAQVLEGEVREKAAFEKKHYDHPQQMMREHLPKVSSQLFGRHYKRVNQIASFISPQLNDKLSDYFFDQLNDFVSKLSSVDALLRETGVQNLSELVQDPARSRRITRTIASQNKLIAGLLGALSGGGGVIGAAIDVPASIALALRSIYQTGRAYGFELKPDDHEVVEYIFKQIDLGAVAEKQALLAVVRNVASMTQTHDVSQLQQLLGSGNNTEILRRWFFSEDGTAKWSWLGHVPRLNGLSRLTPLVSMGISAVYSWKLVDDATDQADRVFSLARQYLLQHPGQAGAGTWAVYEKAVQLQSVALLSAPVDVQTEQQPQQLKNTADAGQVAEPDQKTVSDETVSLQAAPRKKQVGSSTQTGAQPQQNSKNKRQGAAVRKTTAKAAVTTGSRKTAAASNAEAAQKTVTKKRATRNSTVSGGADQTGPAVKKTEQ